MLARLMSYAVLPLWVCTGLCLAQEPAPAPVDRTDPQAVAQAFLAALDAADAKASAELLAGSEEFRQAWLTAAEVMAPQRGGAFDATLLEMTFLPIGLGAAERQFATAAQGNDTLVTVAERPQRVRKLILARDAEGRWSVDLRRSILATTGRDRSFVADAIMGAGGEGGAEMLAMARDAAIRRAADVVMEWAKDHGNVLPPAETWLDDVEGWTLDPEPLQRPGAGEGECGYALNMELTAKPLPPQEDWPNVVLLFECADFARNATGDPEEELLPTAAGRPDAAIVTPSGAVLRVPTGLTPAETIAQNASYSKCQSHVRALCRALLAYARAHDGYLPAGATWCDDIEPYLRKADAPEDAFRCPGAPELQYGYALNEAMAGADVRAVQKPDSTILLLPSEAGTRNEVRAVPDRVVEARHLEQDRPTISRVVHVGFLDGHAGQRTEGGAYQGEDL